MLVLREYGTDDLARVFIARMRDGDPRSMVEFVESVQPPIPRDEKWVIIVSSMFGCPVGCRMCDAGGRFSGMLTTSEILSQVDECVRRRYPDRRVPARKFKVQFSRMGEPTMNPAVLEALRLLPTSYDSPGLMPSLSTVAPAKSSAFFQELIDIKEELYSGGRFQLQFSIHTTDLGKRRDLIPVRTWTFEQMAAFGKRFYQPEEGDRKTVLNFALMRDHPIDASVIREHFSPDRFIIKLTPLNPTLSAMDNGITSIFDNDATLSGGGLVEGFVKRGYDVILSTGEAEENQIGSNCGQYVQRTLNEGRRPPGGYDLEGYDIEHGVMRWE